jgi:hypothetical protein
MTDEEKKEYHRQKSRAHYLKHNATVNARSMERRQQIRNYIVSIKANGACVECGEDHPACLDFHHRDPAKKKRHIAEYWTAGWSLATVKAEIAKCDLLCANCHRKLHWNEQDGIE